MDKYSRTTAQQAQHEEGERMNEDTIRAMAEAVTEWRDEMEEWYAKDPKRKAEAEEWYRIVKERVKRNDEMAG